MQVATLFRETATLLGASMEASEGPGLKLNCGNEEWQQSKQNYSDPPMMKQEANDDGYETSGGDIDMRDVNKSVMMSPHGHPHAHAHPHAHPHSHSHQHPHSHPHTHPHVHPHQHSHPHSHPHQHDHTHPHAHEHRHPHSHPHTHSHMMPTNSVVKYEMNEDPYSFVDEDQMQLATVQCPPLVMPQVPKKRGRKKKIKLEDQQQIPGMGYPESPITMKSQNTVKVFKERKKHDRFNGMPEEEVSKRTLPDHLTQNLDIVIIGINPGLFAAYKGHHYAGPGNHFWKCLYLSGLTPEPMTADDDYKLLKVGIGFTNMVERATKGSADLTRKEIKEGSQILLEKLQKFKPKIAVFNGKLIFEVFSGKKDFSFGRQPDLVDGTNTYMWVMPSSSARCAQLPRAADKVPFYAALKKFRDYLNGLVPELDEKEIVFTYSKLKNFFEPDVKEEGKGGIYCDYNNDRVNSLTDLSNAVIKKEGDQGDQPSSEQPRKKRGRPKKIKIEGAIEVKEEPRPKVVKEGNKDPEATSDVPKKKRGRPKKIKTEGSMKPAMNMVKSELSNQGPTHLSDGFSGAIPSPMNLCQQGFPGMYSNPQPYQNQNSSQSPLSSHTFHQSPIHNQSHSYNQSPQPSQPPSFTHSDLSSEISAAISSDQNLGSRSPGSPSLGPPDFEPPTSMHEESSKSPPLPTKEEPDESHHVDCHFSNSATPTRKKSPDLSYHSYEEFSGDSESHSSVRYPQRPPSVFTPKTGSINQDVSSKSLSGLESLVDQIPNISDGDAPHTVESLEPSHSTYNEDSSYLSDYPRVSHYSPQYTASTPTPSMNFSVTSLASSSAVSSDDTPSSFSVSSLASNYSNSASSYAGLMGPPHPMESTLVDRGGMSTCVNMNMYNGMYNPYNPSTPYHPSALPSTHPAAAGFPYAPNSALHNLHVPAPNFPYPSPYSNSPYTQTGGYLPNHVFDRIKSERMDIGFGQF